MIQWFHENDPLNVCFSVPFPEAPAFSRQQHLPLKSNRLVPRVLLRSNSDNDLIVNAVRTQRLASRCFIPQPMQSDPNRRVKTMGCSTRSIQSCYSLSAICLGEGQSILKKRLAQYKHKFHRVLRKCQWTAFYTLCLSWTLHPLLLTIPHPICLRILSIVTQRCWDPVSPFKIT